MSEEKSFRQLSQRVEGLIAKTEAIADPNARANAMDLTQALMELHGAGLERLMDLVAKAGDSGFALMDEFAGDELVASLLLLYGLHPYDMETRVLTALEQARPVMKSHGGDVELLGIADGVVRLRLAGTCRGCPSSTVTLRQAVERAIYEAAPDVAEIFTEGVLAAGEPAPANGLTQLKGLSGAPSNEQGYDQCVSLGPAGR
jgi:Fe-S cluster biogenesis protein NfuA